MMNSLEIHQQSNLGVGNLLPVDTSTHINMLMAMEHIAPQIIH